MQWLTEEILIEIFNYLPENDLISLTRTCKAFNEIISNTSKIVQRFCVKFNPLNKNSEWIRRRKYKKIKFSHCDNNLFLRFQVMIDANGSCIKEIEIEECSIEDSSLKLLLFTCPNVKSLTLIKVNHLTNSNVSYEGNLDLNLIKLKFNETSLEFLEILQNCTQLKEISLAYYAETEIQNALNGFLITQNDLKVLRLEQKAYDYDYEHSCEIFKNIEEFSFELENIEFISFYLNRHENLSENFKMFLDNQRESLKSMTLKNSDFQILMHCRNFEKLTTLRIETEYYNSLNGEFPYIKNVEMTYANYSSMWNELFPNIENLKIKNQKYVYDAYVFIPSRVKKLIYENCIFKKFKFPKDYDENNEIEELSLHNCRNAAWLKSFLTHKKKKKLKLLELIDVDVGNDSRRQKDVFSMGIIDNKLKLLKKEIGEV